MLHEEDKRWRRFNLHLAVDFCSMWTQETPHTVTNKLKKCEILLKEDLQTSHLWARLFHKLNETLRTQTEPKSCMDVHWFDWSVCKTQRPVGHVCWALQPKSRGGSRHRPSVRGLAQGRTVLNRNCRTFIVSADAGQTLRVATFIFSEPAYDLLQGCQTDFSSGSTSSQYHMKWIRPVKQ